MLRKYSRAFSTGKYFLDEKHHNFTLTTHSRHGSLSEISKIFAETGANFSYIRSRFTNAWTDSKNYTLDISTEKLSQEQLGQMAQKLNQQGVKFNRQDPIKIPWFPRNRSDLDKIGKVLLDVKDQVNKDHLQFSDPQYRKRRDFIADIARNYKMGDDIPDVPYTKEENQLWRHIYGKLSGLHQKAMSQRYLKHVQDLENQFLFSQRIPQLSELNIYLKNKTGFSVKPTHGILSQRQFLNCFAFKTFCCTQYIRHTKTPEYTPEPDIVHQIVGHVPMFADPQVANLSHSIGLLSLGASDQQIAMLGTLYWYTLQFGACLEGKQRLGYGAGIASSIGEIENFISGKPKFQKFNPQKDCNSSYPIQTVQEVYRVTESFDEALKQLQQFGRTINKPIQTTYNYKKKQIEYNRCVEAIDFGDQGPTF